MLFLQIREWTLLIPVSMVMADVITFVQVMFLASIHAVAEKAINLLGMEKPALVRYSQLCIVND